MNNYPKLKNLTLERLAFASIGAIPRIVVYPIILLLTLPVLLILFLDALLS